MKNLTAIGQTLAQQDEVMDFFEEHGMTACYAREGDAYPITRSLTQYFDDLHAGRVVRVTGFYERTPVADVEIM